MDWQNDFAPLNLTSEDTLPSLAIAPLHSWAAITMVGDDKKSYLQGQITSDVVSLNNDESTLGAHCDAKGKVWSTFRLFHHNGGYAMLQPRDLIERELAEIKKYAVFSKVEIEISSDAILGVIGEHANQFIDSISTTEGDVREVEGGTAVKVDEQRWVLLISENAAIQFVEQSQAEKVTQELWTLLDILTVQPILNAEQQNEHIPQALNLQALNGISFNKGCYTGQETVARAKFRGTNKRALYLVEGEADSDIAKNAEFERAVGENWRSAGKLLSSYQYNDGKAVALVVLPNNLETDTQFRLKDQPDHLWALASQPYSLEDEE